MNKPLSSVAAIRGEEHWTDKGSDVRLFLWNKHGGDPSGPAGRILFVHGSSMASQPTFDLQVPGRADSSVMDFFAAPSFHDDRGSSAWVVVWPATIIASRANVLRMDFMDLVLLPNEFLGSLTKRRAALASRPP